jgi:tetratricopeptide (TPR) repeat protein
MSTHNRIRLRQTLREAEGYLELGMPRQALDALDRVRDPGSFRASLLRFRGEALRALDRYDEAIVALTDAAELDPDNLPVLLALAWCQKRTGHLDLAIAALEQALDHAPSEALVIYNLACYCSLAGQKRRALDLLSRAIDLDAHYRDLLMEESDFDPIRHDPRFQSLVSIIV